MPLGSTTLSTPPLVERITYLLFSIALNIAAANNCLFKHLLLVQERLLELTSKDAPRLTSWATNLLSLISLPDKSPILPQLIFGTDKEYQEEELSLSRTNNHSFTAVDKELSGLILFVLLSLFSPYKDKSPSG